MLSKSKIHQDETLDLLESSNSLEEFLLLIFLPSVDLASPQSLEVVAVVVVVVAVVDEVVADVDLPWASGDSPAGLEVLDQSRQSCWKNKNKN